jgi:hypothetical protein
MAVNFLERYFDSKQRAPTTTSAVVVLPLTPSPPWQRFLRHLKLVHDYSAGTQLFTSLDSNGERCPSRPTTCKYAVYYDAPAASVKPVEVFTLAAFPDAAQELIVFDGSFAGRPARILLDGGASRDFVSNAFALRWSLPLVNADRLRVRCANGSVIYTS